MRKNILLTALLSLVAAFGMAQTATWPITLTKADGLPGQYAGMHYEFSTELYKFDEAISTLRFTVCSTNTVEEQTTGTDGLSTGWGPGFPFFTMSELAVLDANGQAIEYTVTSNAAAANNDGSIENLNNGNYTDHFHSTYYTGECPQEYHYLELEFTAPISEFKLVWQTRSNLKNMPTYVGLTPGTEYLPYPEQEMNIAKQVTSLEELAEEGAVFLIKGNAPEYVYTVGGYTRTYPGGGFWHCPYGGHVTANAASLVYLIPEPGVENSYKVCWLNNGHYLSNQETNAWFNWTDKLENAGYLQFSMCDTVPTDFIITHNDSMIVGHDGLGKMTHSYYDEEKMANRSRPTAWNFSIYKAEISAGTIASQLTDLIADAKARMEALGAMEDYDTEGAYDALQQAVAAAESATTASEILKAKLGLQTATPAYAIVGLNAYLDSMDVIMTMLENGDLATSEAPEWVNGTFPTDAQDLMQAAQDNVLLVFDNYRSIADVDAGMQLAIAAIDGFWASQINNVISLPYRIGLPELGLPGEKQSNGSFRWESPVYYLGEETDVLRFTVFDTNNHDNYADTKFMFPTYGEMIIMNALGDTIKLTELDWSSNSVHPTDGAGLAGLCDGNIDQHYHAYWSAGQSGGEAYDANPAYVYIEAQLPEAISSFKFVQYGRKNSVNTPIDFAISAGTEITPDEIGLPYPYSIELGEQITDASQIVDGDIYVIRGLFNCNAEAPIEGLELGEPRYYAGADVYGKILQAPAAFLIQSTGAGDGTFYIQSMKDGQYWTKTTDENGWGNAGSTLDITVASKVKIEPANNSGLPGSFVIYEYCDSMMRDGESVPYVIFQDWGENLATYSVTGLDMNDLDGEGEWYINKAIMPEGNLYMLSGLLAEAEAYSKLRVGSDPGFYSEEVVGAFKTMYDKALKAKATNNEAEAKNYVLPLFNAILAASVAEPNPVTPGIYVFESSYDNASWNGVKKAMYAYYNNTPDDQYIGSLLYKMYWSNAPDDVRNPHERFQFELIPATEDINLGLWREAGYITAADSLNAFYIKHVETGYYIKGAEGLYRGIGLTPTPESPFVIRLQDDNDFDIYCPLNDGEWTAYRSLYFRNSGSASSDVSTWSPGGNETAKFHFRRVGTTDGIDTPIINGEEGDVLVSTSYYTVGGAAVSAPVKGINIVKKVYANGVVETKKVFVK